MTHEEYAQYRETAILDALDAIKKNGFQCRLCNKQNGHIQVISRLGRIINFYPTTGTIAGYDWYQFSGIECLLRIAEEG